VEKIKVKVSLNQGKSLSHIKIRHAYDFSSLSHIKATTGKVCDNTNSNSKFPVFDLLQCFKGPGYVFERLTSLLSCFYCETPREFMMI
jgi:hypothetical protein